MSAWDLSLTVHTCEEVRGTLLSSVQFDTISGQLDNLSDFVTDVSIFILELFLLKCICLCQVDPQVFFTKCLLHVSKAPLSTYRSRSHLLGLLLAVRLEIFSESSTAATLLLNRLSRFLLLLLLMVLCLSFLGPVLLTLLHLLVPLILTLLISFRCL